MSNKKQSSVRWLLKELEDFENGTSVYFSKAAIINQADRMHKEEIEQSYMSGAYDKATIFEEAQTYYTKTFGGDNE